MTAQFRLKPEAIGLGLTSQRVRDRLIERLRANGIEDERVLHAIRTGNISITPIHVDLTRYQALEHVASWVSGLAASLERTA